MENKTLSSKQMILDIGSIRTHARKLLKTPHAYNALLEALTENDFYYDEEAVTPTLKGLAAKTSIPYTKLRKLLQQIYVDLLPEYGDNTPFMFPVVEYCFIAGGPGDRAIYLTTQSLLSPPRLGEQITLPYFKAYLEEDTFYVEHINHYFEDSKLSVCIYLRPGYYNTFWNFRKDQAIEEGELDHRDLIDHNDYELKRKLKLGRYRHW